MRLRVVLIAVFGALSFGAEEVLSQQHFEFWSFLDHNRPLTRCSETSAAHRVAIERLRRLETLVDRLQPAGDPKPVLESFDALLKTECFLIASEVQDLPRPDSAASMKDWAERGAFEWLWSYLKVPKLGTLPNLQPHIILPPDVRSTLTVDSSREHALSPFLCSARDANCGAQTRGWKARAEVAFTGPLNQHWDSDPADRLSDECLAKASSEGPERKYMTWHACIQGRRPKTAAFPIDEFKAPLSGWLVMSGRRGHYEFCDSTTAYDLESGTAVRSESCSGLALKPGGAVGSRCHQ